MSQSSRNHGREGLRGLGDGHHGRDVLAVYALVLHELARAEEIELHHAADDELQEDEDRIVGVFQHLQGFEHRIARRRRLERMLEEANGDHEDRKDGGQIEAVGPVAAGFSDLAQPGEKIADQRPGDRRPEEYFRRFLRILGEEHFIDQRQRGRVADRVEEHDDEHAGELRLFRREEEEHRAEGMADEDDPLGVEPFVGQIARDERREDAGQRERRVNPAGLLARHFQRPQKPNGQNGHPGPPNREFQKHERAEAEIKIPVPSCSPRQETGWAK